MPSQAHREESIFWPPKLKAKTKRAPGRIPPLGPPEGSPSSVSSWRTASPAHADFGGLSSLTALVVIRLDVVPFPPRSPRRRYILLDVIGGVESALLEACPGTITGVSQYWFSGHFRQVFSTPMHYPALTLAPTCGANRAS